MHQVSLIHFCDTSLIHLCDTSLIHFCDICVVLRETGRVVFKVIITVLLVSLTHFCDTSVLETGQIAFMVFITQYPKRV